MTKKVYQHSLLDLLLYNKQMKSVKLRDNNKNEVILNIPDVVDLSADGFDPDVLVVL
jgi:hypothetical protein